MMRLRPILAVVVFLAAQGSVCAQQPPVNDPGAIQKHDTDTFQYFELQKKLDQLRQQQAEDKAKKSGQPGSNGLADSTANFLLQHVIVNPSELISQTELNSVLVQYEGKRVSLADLNQLINQLNSLYAQKGYTTAKAILPAQHITNGEIKIMLVEGHVGRISIANKTHTRDSYILNRVRFQSGELLRMDGLQHDLIHLNDTNDLQVRAVLEPGASFGTSNINLRVEEPKNQRSMLLLDNAGRDGVGNNRVGIVENYASVFGLRDPFMLGVYWATGTLDTFASYNIPLNYWGTRLGFNYDFNRIRIVSGPTANFGIEGTSKDAGLRLTEPLVETSRMRWSVSLLADYITSRLRSENIPLSDTMVHSYGLSSDMQEFDRHGLWTSNQTFIAGVHNLIGTRSFFKYNGSFARVQNLAWGAIAVVRFNGQTNAWNYLPPVEQFQVGGMATVRGYPEGRQIGDRGYAASGELQIPPPFQQHRIHSSIFGQKLREAVFFDNGAVYDSYRKFGRPPGDNRYLSSVGSGLIMKFSDYFVGRVDVGFPLRNTLNIPHCRLHFNIQSSPPLASALKKSFRAWEGH